MPSMCAIAYASRPLNAPAMIEAEKKMRSPLPTSTTQNNGSQAHSLPIKRVQWNPFSNNSLFTASFDMTSKQIYLSDSFANQLQLTPSFQARSHPSLNQTITQSRIHSEFITALDQSLSQPGQFATGGWDGRIQLYRTAAA